MGVENTWLELSSPGRVESRYIFRHIPLMCRSRRHFYSHELINLIFELPISDSKCNPTQNCGTTDRLCISQTPRQNERVNRVWVAQIFVVSHSTAARASSNSFSPAVPAM